MDRRIELLISQMENQISGNWNTETLARQVNLSASRLRHLFKEQTGMTPSQYLRSLRLSHAKHLLQTTFLTIKEIASLVGLSTTNFVREFKLLHDCTPTEYRESLNHISQQ
jgi:transcriptional regulator GlxA family with amidase domain